MANEFILHNTDELQEVAGYVFEHFEGNNKPLKCIITNFSRRSLSQNALMWKWLTEICEQIRNKGKGEFEPDDLHEYFKARYCPQKTLMFGDKELYVSSTKRLDKGEMTRYLDCVHAWSVDAGFKLTIPEDSEYAKLNRLQSE